MFIQVSVCLWGPVCPLPRRPPARETPSQTPLPGRPPHRPPCQGDPLTDLPARETPTKESPRTRETPCQGDTPHQGDSPVKETPSRPTPRGEIEGGRSRPTPKGENSGGSNPSPHRRGKFRGIEPDTPPPNNYCCGRYASYWNAFLFLKNK